MKLDLINPYVIKIVISARKKDSIRAIAKRIGLSYGWAYNWVQELIAAGMFKKKEQGIVLQENSKFYKDIIAFIRKTFARDVSFYYSLLQLFGIRYCFTKTDAVFVWTKGGYNISRYRDYYPIFIKIKKADEQIFSYYAKKLCLSKKNGVFYSAEIFNDFKIDYCDGVPVDSLRDTIAFMQENIYNFQPALEMIKEMYGKKIKVAYKEVITNV